MTIKQYYQVLELPPGASLEEVKRAYRDLVQVWHPDRFPHNERLQTLATQKFMELNQAYRMLTAIHGETPDSNAPSYSSEDGLIDWRPKSRLHTQSQPPQETPPPQPEKQSPPSTKRNARRAILWRWHHSLLLLPLIWLTAIITIQIVQSNSPTTTYTSPEVSLPRPEPVLVRPTQTGITTPASAEDTLYVATADSIDTAGE